MQDETALYGAKMMQPGLTTADNEENSLRPQHLEDYIGQDKVKQNLKIYLEAAKRRGEPSDFLNDLGCDYIQGYYFGRPMSQDQYEKLTNHDEEEQHDMPQPESS